MQPLSDFDGSLDPRVLVFVVAATLLTGIGFGLAPAWRLSHANPNDALKNMQRSVRTWLGRLRLGDRLVVGQMALALVLLVGAGLLIRSLHRILQVPSGIWPERVLTLQVALPWPSGSATPSASPPSTPGSWTRCGPCRKSRPRPRGPAFRSPGTGTPWISTSTAGPCPSPPSSRAQASTV